MGITWKDIYSVKIPEIDEDHKLLLDYLNEIDDLSRRSKLCDAVTTTEVELIMKKLFDYTAEHFAQEERMMQLHAYPGFEAHRKIHQGLIRECKELEEWFRTSGFTALPRMVEFLGAWWKGHILITDAEYSSFLAPKVKRQKLEAEDVEAVEELIRF